MNRHTLRAETYWKKHFENHPISRKECELKTCLKVYGSNRKISIKICKFTDHTFCHCLHCGQWPTCLRCRLFINNGHYI